MTATFARRTGACTLIAATTLALAACGGVGAKVTYEDTEKGKITAIVIDDATADVTVRTSAAAETHVTRVYRGTSNPKDSYHIVGTELHIANQCRLTCHVEFQIQAPAGVAVRGKLTSGDVALTDVGATDLSLTSGDVVVHGATGPVKIKATSGDLTVSDAKAGATMEATSGDVQATNISGPVDATVDSGDATVRMDAPASVTARTGSGDLHLAVPTGGYQIRTHHGSGDVHLGDGVTNDASAKNVLDLRVGSGDLTVETA